MEAKMVQSVVPARLHYLEPGFEISGRVPCIWEDGAVQGSAKPEGASVDGKLSLLGLDLPKAELFLQLVEVFFLMAESEIELIEGGIELIPGPGIGQVEGGFLSEFASVGEIETLDEQRGGRFSLRRDGDLQWLVR